MRRAVAVGTLLACVAFAATGPSTVQVSGTRLLLGKRQTDGSLAPALPYTIRGVNWSPASRETASGSPAVRRPEFAKWYLRDIPLMAAMNVNTVRVFIDMGLDASATAVMDELYRNNIMVIMTVDDGINDQGRIASAVNFYKDHPAVLMWMVGNEWNVNRYYTDPQISVDDAATRTENAAVLIKNLDNKHPVSTSYGDITSPGTQGYVATKCASVDIWGLNIYRGSSFGNLFDQWQQISSKPMFLAEFGTDAWRSYSGANPPPGSVDAGVQADWTLLLWDEIFRKRSEASPTLPSIGGVAFEWNDEWWKVAPAGSQQPNGYYISGGHPDDFSNEEYFGVVDIDRQPRDIHCVLGEAFKGSYSPSAFAAPIFRATSRGASSEPPPAGQTDFPSVSRFYKNGKIVYERSGGGGGGRGFNAMAVDPTTGATVRAAENFDTWATRNTGTAMNALIAWIDSVPSGALILLAVADDAGITLDNSCAKPSTAWTGAGIQKIESLGSRQIRSYCFRDSWALVALKGGGVQGEGLGRGILISAANSVAASLCNRGGLDLLSPVPGSTLTSSVVDFLFTPNPGSLRSYDFRLVNAQTDKLEFSIGVIGNAINLVYTLKSGQYRAEMRSCNPKCGGTVTSQFAVQLPSPPQSPPGNLACLAANSSGQNQLGCNWSALTGADFYQVNVVQPGVGPGGGALTVAGNQTGLASLTALIPNGASSVLVRGCNGDGCGPFAGPFPVSSSFGNPVLPILAEPFAGVFLDSGTQAPVVIFTWNRVAGDTGSNYKYRLYVQDFSRNAAALDAITANNFYAAYLNPFTRYDALVIATPNVGGSGSQGPAQSFLVKGRVPNVPSVTRPTLFSTVPAGVVAIAWTPLPDANGNLVARNYQYNVGGPTAVGGVATSLQAIHTLSAGSYSVLVRACTTGTSCTANAEAGWGPWTGTATAEGGVGLFTVQ